ncbi:glycosyltransferase family 4 protein [Snuella sedimenti]|uniref:Glycosyltransferase family 4 protein n=1 Tax=Snuella sedimenti TaxID=2798802 RepID=A0A8J7IHD6_9FLAO|nr:glycosyltransferase family 4 protein [Snuella sedimenti]MBJ6367891.1 glycosyltransferase family 4 protein [Snuella sedimenti]
MKIGVVTGSFPEVSETFVVNQINSLKTFGHDVSVFCFKMDVANSCFDAFDLIEEAIVLNWKSFMPATIFKKFFLIKLILIKALLRGVFIDLFFSLFFKKGKIVNTHNFFKQYFKYYFKIQNYSILHIHFGTNAVNMIEQIKAFNKKTIVTFHGYDAHNYSEHFYKTLFNQPNVFFTVNTNYVKKRIVALGASNSKISILPMGLDTDYFKPKVKKNSKVFNLLFVGRLIPLKAPLMSIKIVHRLKLELQRQVCFHIVGDGSEMEVCKAYVSDHNLESNVVFHGSKPQDYIKQLMEQSDVFLFPGIIDQNGRCEAQGLVIQEAQSMKLPVVISDVGGMKEGVVDGESGFVVTEKNLEEFVKKIVFLIEHEEVRKKMGEIGREFVKQHYDSTFLHKKWLEIYSEL